MITLKVSLKPGDPAPDFFLADDQGRTRRLGNYAGHWLVLFFYPADFTTGCTIESCLFRDEFQAFHDAGAGVVGVSGDTVDSHAAFRARHALPFPLLADPGRQARRAYGVPHIFGRLSGRTTFVIDPQGVIRYVFNSRSRFHDHVRLTLAFLKELH